MKTESQEFVKYSFTVKLHAKVSNAYPKSVMQQAPLPPGHPCNLVHTVHGSIGIAFANPELHGRRTG